MRLRPLSPVGGTEVLGVDLAEPLSEEMHGRLRAAWREHGVLVFRAQELDDAEQLRAAEIFGSIARNKKHDDEAHSYVSNVAADGVNPYGGLGFHLDDSFEPEPLAGLILYGLEVPPEGAGGETLFANVSLAYRSLPAALCERIRDLHVVHSWPDLSKQVPMPGPDPRPGLPSATHPMVLRHPVTGEELLFLSPRHFDRIIGMEAEPAKELVLELSAAIADPAVVYAHAWRRGDFVLWDNLRFQHGRADFDRRHRRHLRRTLIARAAVDDRRSRSLSMKETPSCP
ncbi:MAG: TauD/TfdA family dioxygenase [Vulcanimicrobiaceae bacterium]